MLRSCVEFICVCSFVLRGGGGGGEWKKSRSVEEQDGVDSVSAGEKRERTTGDLCTLFTVTSNNVNSPWDRKKSTPNYVIFQKEKRFSSSGERERKPERSRE